MPRQRMSLVSIRACHPNPISGGFGQGLGIARQAPWPETLGPHQNRQRGACVPVGLFRGAVGVRGNEQKSNAVQSIRRGVRRLPPSCCQVLLKCLRRGDRSGFCTLVFICLLVSGMIGWSTKAKLARAEAKNGLEWSQMTSTNIPCGLCVAAQTIDRGHTKGLYGTTNRHSVIQAKRKTETAGLHYLDASNWPPIMDCPSLSMKTTQIAGHAHCASHTNCTKICIHQTYCADHTECTHHKYYQWRTPHILCKPYRLLLP